MGNLTDKHNKLHKKQLKKNRLAFMVGTVLLFALMILAYVSKKNANKQTKFNSLLQKRYDEVVEASNTATNALKVKSEFLDSVTHELKTPLNTIKSVTYLLQIEKHTKEQTSRLELLNTSTDNLRNLIDEIMNLEMPKEHHPENN